MFDSPIRILLQVILQVEFSLNFERDFTSRENTGLEKDTAIYSFSTTSHAAASYFYPDIFIDFKFFKNVVSIFQLLMLKAKKRRLIQNRVKVFKFCSKIKMTLNISGHLGLT